MPPFSETPVSGVSCTPLCRSCLDFDFFAPQGPFSPLKVWALLFFTRRSPGKDYDLICYPALCSFYFFLELSHPNFRTHDNWQAYTSFWRWTLTSPPPFPAFFLHSGEPNALCAPIKITPPNFAPTCIFAFPF